MQKYIGWAVRSVGALSALVGGFMLRMSVAYADCVATPDTPECVATSAGTVFKSAGIAVLLILIPLAIALIVAVRAFSKARSMVKL